MLSLTPDDRRPPALPTDKARWDAVKRRDSSADFYYSIATTGVYCRPSCAARLPRRENVAFHATCVDAERAGFRPCKRCRPAAQNAPTPSASDRNMTEQIKSLDWTRIASELDQHGCAIT